MGEASGQDLQDSQDWYVHLVLLVFAILLENSQKIPSIL
jgi:hypothetical protein